MCDKKHYDELEDRVTALEGEVADMRRETRDGLAAVNANIETLSQQMTNMDTRMLAMADEKRKWGETLRGIVKWTARAILAVVTYAAGVNLTKDLIPGFFN